MLHVTFVYIVLKMVSSQTMKYKTSKRVIDKLSGYLLYSIMFI